MYQKLCQDLCRVVYAEEMKYRAVKEKIGLGALEIVACGGCNPNGASLFFIFDPTFESMAKGANLMNQNLNSEFIVRHHVGLK